MRQLTCSNNGATRASVCSACESRSLALLQRLCVDSARLSPGQLGRPDWVAKVKLAPRYLAEGAFRAGCSFAFAFAFTFASTFTFTTHREVPMKRESARRPSERSAGSAPVAETLPQLAAVFRPAKFRLAGALFKFEPVGALAMQTGGLVGVRVHL